MSKKHLSVEQASTIGVIGSVVNVGLELGATKYFGGRASIADMPHQLADVLAYGAVLGSRYIDVAKQKLERASSWIVSAGSYAVATGLVAETLYTKISETDLEPVQTQQAALLAGVLAINGAIHWAQDAAHHHHHEDNGAVVNHKHAKSELYATGALIAGVLGAVALDAPLVERGVALAAALYVGYTNWPEDN